MQEIESTSGIRKFKNKDDEIRRAFKKARVRLKKAKTAKEREEAEMEFFETLIRVHREGEGVCRYLCYFYSRY